MNKLIYSCVKKLLRLSRRQSGVYIFRKVKIAVSHEVPLYHSFIYEDPQSIIGSAYFSISELKGIHHTYL